MKSKIPQLDAVRGIAILVVIFHNSGYLRHWFADGWMGVDLFFVLSGFLITGILLDTRQSDSYFKNFYARRCLRIWPLYYAVLLLMLVVIPLARPSLGRSILEKSSPWWGYPVYLQNFALAIPTQGAGPLGVTWSLAIEEQFYLAWAMVVRFCSSASLRRIAIAVICISPVLRYVLLHDGVFLYANVFCRLDGLMAGSLLAVLLRSENFIPARFVRPAWILFFASALLAWVLAHFGVQAFVYSASAAASFFFVYVSLFSRLAAFQWVMTNRFLMYTGTISYGLYLLHKIPVDLTKTSHRFASPLIALPAILAISYTLAIVSWNVLEKPFLRLKRFFGGRTGADAALQDAFLTPDGSAGDMLGRGPVRSDASLVK